MASEATVQDTPAVPELAIQETPELVVEDPPTAPESAVEDTPTAPESAVEDTPTAPECIAEDTLTTSEPTVEDNPTLLPASDVPVMSESPASLTLIDILSNEYFLLATTPYLLPTEILALSQCSRSYYSIITHSRSVWRNLNLSVSPHPPVEDTTAIAQRHPTPLYQTNLTALLQKPFVLRDVQTLVLDGLPVTNELLGEILGGSRYRIQLLSIRECSLINERVLTAQLEYLVRTKQTTLKGCYWFGNMDFPGAGILPSATTKPRARSGRFLNLGKLTEHASWATVMDTCENHIAFDTRLCSSPRHEDEDQQLASIRLSPGCTGCGTSPEAKARRVLPRVVCAPVPITTSDIRVACRGEGEGDVLRCEMCAKDRWCEGCGKWWCDDCATNNKNVSLDCYECGTLCTDCTNKTSRTCGSCRGEYCIIHNTGADDNWCEWCKSPGGARLWVRESPPRAAIPQPRIGIPPPMPRMHRHGHHHNPGAAVYNQQHRARTLARLNAIRSNLGMGRFKDEQVVRNRYALSVFSV